MEFDRTEVAGPEDGTSVPDPFRRESIEWPTRPQTVKQIGLLVVVLLIWGGGMYGALNLPTTSGSDSESAARTERRDRRRAAAEERDAGNAGEAGSTANGSPQDRSGTTGSESIGDATNGATGADMASSGQPPDGATRPTATSSGSLSASRVIGSSGATGGPQATGDGLNGGSDATPADDSDDGPSDVIDQLVEERTPLAGLGDISALPAASFSRDVMPILKRRCVKCHGAERDDGTGPRIEEGLSLMSWNDIMKGSTWGSVVEPGDPVGSYMLELILEGDMPEKAPRLLPRELRLIAAWIRDGATGN